MGLTRHWWLWLLPLAVALVLFGCATALPRVADPRVLDEDGCLIDVDWRSDGTPHVTYLCEVKSP